MNKKTFMLLVAALFIVKATAQQVEQKQRTLLIKTAATWCPPCGTWGWDLFEGMIEDNEENALLIAVHHSGLLENDINNDLFSNFGAVYQPMFFVDETNINATSSNASTKRSETAAAVTDVFNNQAPVANVGFTPTFANNKLSVNAKVKFYQETEGEFYLSVYLMEDGVIEFQQSIGNNAVHKKIIRSGFTDDTFGELVTTGSVSADQEFDMSFELQIGEVAGYDYEVAGIIWKKENDKYLPVNVWSTKNIETTSSVKDVDGIADFSVKPNVTSSQAVINIDLDENIKNLSLDLVDINGKVISQINRGNFNKGSQTFFIDKSLVQNNGLFFVRLTDGKNVSTRKIIFQ
ncbi:MAG: Omp28-related outer membrane protein [Bacteroidota bacterium]